MFRQPTRSGARAAEPTTPWEIGVEVEVQVALAVSRASVRALMSLSPHADSVMRDALAKEVDALRLRSDPLSLAAASNLLEILSEAA
jgi:hypothetical protein